MIFDTDILIWVQRGNTKAGNLIEKADRRFLSMVGYMELLQGARNRRELETIRQFLKDFGFQTLSLSENIGHRAAIYIEEYSLSHGLRVADALVAATATENDLVLCTSNLKHYRPIKDLRMKAFRPS